MSLNRGWEKPVDATEIARREGIAWAMSAMGLRELTITDYHANRSLVGKRMEVLMLENPARIEVRIMDDVTIDGAPPRLGEMRRIGGGSAA